MNVIFKSTKAFDAAVYEVLVAFRDGADLKILRTKYGDVDFSDVVEHCFNHGMIKPRYPAKRTNSGMLIFDEKSRITRQGLSFIEQFG